MKIKAEADQLLIDNSLFMAILGGVIFAACGIAVGILGYLNSLWWMLLLAPVLLVIGVLIVVFVKSTHIVLSKTGDSSIAAKTLFSSAQTSTFALADVQAVQLQYSLRQRRRTQSDGGSHTETEAKSVLYLTTSTGGIIQLGSETQLLNVGMLGAALVQVTPLKKEAEFIANFIGVPLQVSEGAYFSK